MIQPSFSAFLAIFEIPWSNCRLINFETYSRPIDFHEGAILGSEGDFWI